MKITIITDGQPYVFEKVSYISVDHEEGDTITQTGTGEGFIIEDEVEYGETNNNRTTEKRNTQFD